MKALLAIGLGLTFFGFTMFIAGWFSNEPGIGSNVQNMLIGIPMLAFGLLLSLISYLVLRSRRNQQS